MRALRYTKDDFLIFLNKLDSRLKEHIFIIALGGTALSLIGLKEKTKDMDFFMEGVDFDYFVNSYTGNKEPMINNFNFVLKEYYSD